MLNNTEEFQGIDTKLSRYREVFDIGQLKGGAWLFKDLKVLHINSVKKGGGVAAILSHIIPLFNDIGIESHWWVPEIFDNDFFNITKRQHNMLQGIDKGTLSEEEQQKYWEVQRKVADILSQHIDKYDLVIIHDTQYIGVVKLIEKKGTKILYRCHIDTSKPNPFIYDFFIPMIKLCDGAIYHLPKFKLKNSPSSFFLLPSIDPFDQKNDINAVSKDYIQSTLTELSLDPDRPILLQVGRFDPAKGFETVSDVFKSVKEDFPEVQLLLTGAGAKDDPEFKIYINKIKGIFKDIPDTVVKELPFDLLRLNAVQQSGTVVYALSKKEGFGLVVSEASIKKRPVIVTNIGGLPEQVLDGKTGYIINNVEDAVEKTENLLKDEELRISMGEEGRKYILSRFITPVHVENYLKIFKSVLGM